MALEEPISISREQSIYAGTLTVLSWVSLGLLIVGFLYYVSGTAPVMIPISELPDLMRHPVAEFNRITKMPVGWQWLDFLGYGDIAARLGIVMLAGSTIICLIAILSELVRKKNFVYVIIVIAQILILLIAASGVINVGSH